MMALGPDAIGEYLAWIDEEDAAAELDLEAGALHSSRHKARKQRRMRRQQSKRFYRHRRAQREGRDNG